VDEFAMEAVDKRSVELDSGVIHDDVELQRVFE